MIADTITAVAIYAGCMALLGGLAFYLHWDKR